MNFAQLDITIVRLLHIVAAFVWVGMSLAVSWVLLPMTQKLAADRGSHLLQLWFAKSPFNRILALAAIVTTLAGVYLFARLSILFDGQWLSTPGMIVLGIGAFFGLAAFGHGIALARLSSGYARLADVALAEGETADESHQELALLEARLIRSGRIGLILTLIALVGMASARYL